MSQRIHEIAKKVGMDNKEMLSLLQQRGFAVKSVSSTIDNISADAIIEEFSPAEAATVEVAAPAPEEKPHLPSGPIVKSVEDLKREKEAAEEAKKAAESSAQPVAPAAPKVPARPAVPAPPPPPRARTAPPAPPAPAARPAPPPPRPSAPANPGIKPPAPPPPVADPVVRSNIPSVTVPPPRPAAPPPPQPPAPKPPMKAPPLPPARPAAAEGETDSTEPVERKKILLKPPIIVRDFAGTIGLKPFQLISELMEMNIFAALNQAIDEEVASRIALAKGFEIEIRHRGEGSGPARKEPVPEVDESALLEPRAPVVCIMGHVDHGKTTLLDAIRRSKVVDDEFGGITQHIGAYQITHNEHPITFLDTPGHEAFSLIRERGASCTDLAVLIVAADDGFKPQTDEALKFARKAGVPVLVAVNKMDAKGANLDRVKQQMQERGIAPEDWGGETITVPISAVKGEGIESLLEMILLQTEVMELKAVFQGKSAGLVLESQLEQGRGATATLILKRGTLQVGDCLLAGTASCKVRAILDDQGNRLKKAGPAKPVTVVGWDEVPVSGQAFETLANEREAKRAAAERRDDEARQREEAMSKLRPAGGSLENLFEAIESQQRRNLRLIIKGDVHGSVEALVQALGEIKSDKVGLEVVSFGVGLVTKKDVEMANTVGASVVGFNTRLDQGVQALAKHYGLAVLQHNIIYEVIDLIKEEMADLLEPELRESKIGAAEVRAVFPLGKSMVAGCMVTEGKLARDARARLYRKGELVHEGRLATLKRFKEDATEVRAGYECGASITGVRNYQEGDTIECFEVQSIRPKL